MNCRTHEHRHFERTLRSTDTIPGPRLAEGRFNKPKLLAPPLREKLRKRRTSDRWTFARERDARVPPSPSQSSDIGDGFDEAAALSLASSEMTPKVCCASERSYIIKMGGEKPKRVSAQKALYKDM